jgi:hypothetical protein
VKQGSKGKKPRGKNIKLTSFVYISEGGDTRSHKKIENERFFGEFEQTIKVKYGAMADDMLSFFDDLTLFFTEQHIPVTEFSKKHIDRLMTEYLNYENLTDAECSMAYQTLLDFADFYLKINSNAAFFKDFLEKKKETIYDYWCFDTDAENKFQELFNNFDMLYAMEQPEMQHKKPDFNDALCFIDDLHCLLDTIRTLAVETKKTNPIITDDDLQNTIQERLTKQIKNISINDCSEETLFSLPKPIAKRFVEIGCKILELNKFSKGSKDYLDTLEALMVFLEKLRDDIKKLKTKKK